MRVGRDPRCDIVICGPGVSRVHAIIERPIGGDYYVVDKGSRNGTRVAGLPLGRDTALQVNVNGMLMLPSVGLVIEPSLGLIYEL